MAQGTIKKSVKPQKKPQKPLPQRGTRVIAPKKTKLIQKKKVLKKHSGGLITLMEQGLGAKAGHLELVNAGKKLEKEKERKKAQSGKK